MVARRLALVVVLLVVSASSARSEPRADDAGSGVDAPGDASTPLLVDFGTYSAYLRQNTGSTRESDWFAAGRTVNGPACVVLDIASETAASASLRLPSQVSPVSLRTTLGPNSPARLAAAVPDFTAAKLGVENLGAIGGIEQGAYTWTWQVQSGGSGDANTGRDAGGAATSALALTTPCITGRLSPLAADATDVYAFQVAGPSTLVLAVAGAAGVLDVTITRDDGTVLGELTSGAANLALPTSGVYYASFSTSRLAEEAYAASFLIGPPDPGQGCRPACLG